MNDIQVLDKNTIDKIAAGEVVERPSSVVKELVENAIDAGATAVTVEITDGGKKLIRITDNGSGIEADEVPRAFLRHATSKIRTVDDLESISSLGFRGEALSSIAAVSQVELITKTSPALSGTRYLISGGTEEKIEETGAPEGTTILVRNLFYNTPARSKFLKSDTTEAGYISSLMEQLALSRPEISFKYIQNRQVRLHSSGNYNLKEVIYSVYGRDIARSLLSVSFENDFMTVSGFIGKPEIARGNRSFENYYINGRFVHDRIIAKAIEDGYKGFLMQHRFPFVVLKIEMRGNELDVNVHPSKMEVRFARGAEVYEAIRGMVQDALSGKSMIPEVRPGKEVPAREVLREKPASVPEPFEFSRRTAEGPALTKPEEELFAGKLNDKAAAAQEKSAAMPEKPAAVAEKPAVMPEKPAAMQEEPVAVAEKPAAAQEKPAPLQQKPHHADVLREEPSGYKPKQLSLFEEQLIDPSARNKLCVIGQIFDTYWLTQYGDSFYIIDQHAAHEKVYYERFLKRFRERTVETQNLCPPMIVTLSMEEEEVLNANMDRFNEAGFEIEHFGGREYSIHTAPSDIYLMSESQLFSEMLDSLTSDGTGSTDEVFTSRLATMACKAAVKGNSRLSVNEAEALIDELLKLDNPYHCPHGRPTIIEMTKQELERKFKRIV